MYVSKYASRPLRERERESLNGDSIFFFLSFLFFLFSIPKRWFVRMMDRGTREGKGKEKKLKESGEEDRGGERG